MTAHKHMYDEEQSGMSMGLQGFDGQRAVFIQRSLGSSFRERRSYQRPSNLSDDGALENDLVMRRECKRGR